MITLKPEHMNVILNALSLHERDVVKEAQEERIQGNRGTWSDAAREEYENTRTVRAALIEERERHPGVTFILAVPGPNQVGSVGETDETGRMIWRAREEG